MSTPLPVTVLSGFLGEANHITQSYFKKPRRLARGGNRQ